MSGTRMTQTNFKRMHQEKAETLKSSRTFGLVLAYRATNGKLPRDAASRQRTSLILPISFENR